MSTRAIHILAAAAGLGSSVDVVRGREPRPAHVNEFGGRYMVNGWGRGAKTGRGSGPTRTEKLAARKAQRQARSKQRRRK